MKRKHTYIIHNLKLSLSIVSLLIVFASCSTSRKVTTNKPKNTTVIHENNKTKSFYNLYSEKLKINFNGNENKNLILFIDKWIGTPYKYGGNTLSGTDCSGLVSNLYMDVYSKKISRTSKSIYNETSPINRDDLKDGDFVFFKTDKSKDVNHVGVYISNDKFIHSTTKKGVMISDLNEEYYKKSYYSSGRIK